MVWSQLCCTRTASGGLLAIATKFNCTLQWAVGEGPLQNFDDYPVATDHDDFEDKITAIVNMICAVFCPMGYECEGTEDKCKPCDVGFYRTGENPYSPCALCPNNTRTLTTGSISITGCNICKLSCFFSLSETLKMSLQSYFPKTF